MRSISLRLLALCVILPPALYILTLLGVESHARRSYTRQLEAALIGDVEALIEGRVALTDRIGANIQRFRQALTLPAWGLQYTIGVTTRTGRMLYPAPVPTDPQALVPLDAAATASDNYRLLQEGLTVGLEVRLPHNTLLANLILAGYIGIALLIMATHYRLAVRQADQEAARTTDLARRMEALSQHHQSMLASAIAEKARLAESLQKARDALDTSRQSADRNEEAMIEEIVALEKKIEANVDQQRVQEREIQLLREKLALVEKQQPPPSPARKRTRRDSAAEVGKRFSALYKETRFHPRAVEGFDDLPQELKLRCEELIQQLDRDPEQVPVKRKVFSKSKEAFFEVIFAYRGRLYFRKAAAIRGVEVVAIGTKNSQDRDLAFLETF